MKKASLGGAVFGLSLVYLIGRHNIGFVPALVLSVVLGVGANILLYQFKRL